MDKHSTPDLEEQTIMWIIQSLSLLKGIEHQKLLLSRSATSLHDPEVVATHERYVNHQYTILEEFFKQILLYVDTYGSPRILAEQTLEKFLAELMSQTYNEI
jgi:hypothetical protein